MKPTEQLKEDHEAIKLMLKIMAAISDKLDNGDSVEPDHLERIIDFIRTFADKCHHGKEEDLLFPAIEEAGIPRNGGPTGMMLVEHDEGRGYVKEMADAAEKYKSGDNGAAKNFAQNARNYINLLAQHIDKENNVLYFIADSHVSAEKQAELAAQFEKVEREKIGPGKHEEYHRLLHQLEEKYLGRTG